MTLNPDKSNNQLRTFTARRNIELQDPGRSWQDKRAGWRDLVEASNPQQYGS